MSAGTGFGWDVVWAASALATVLETIIAEAAPVRNILRFMVVLQSASRRKERNQHDHHKTEWELCSARTEFMTPQRKDCAVGISEPGMKKKPLGI
jgi:hypothetical protein